MYGKFIKTAVIDCEAFLHELIYVGETSRRVLGGA